jgi:membrane fusion protein (multidrug efflux system)
VSDGPSAESLFRKEAIEAHLGVRSEGEVLRLTPRWARFTFGLLVAGFIAAVVYAFVGNIDEYASGIAVVRVDGKSELTARVPGNVAEVLVQPGQRVQRGQLLVRFHGDEAAFERLQQEFDLQLTRLAADPEDQAARASLTSLRAARDEARALLDQRMIKAPSDGVVSDIRIRVGQLLQAGEAVLSLVPDDAHFSVVAILPGNYRPRLKPGMPLRIEMTGFHYAYQEVVIDDIGDEVVGPSEIRRYLGQEKADTLAIAGPVVLVQARLPGRRFQARDKQYDYFDGMQGRAEARVGSESVLVTLIPGLKAVFE